MTRTGNMKRISDKIRESGYVLALLVPLLLLTVVAIYISINDFYTSYRGIEQLPMRVLGEDATEFEIYMRFGRNISIALMPQLVTTIGIYVIISMWPDERHQLQLMERNILIFFVVLVIIAVSVDVLTGYAYYIDPQYQTLIPFFSGEFYADAIARNNVVVALVLSLVIDTISSELFLTVCMGLLVELVPDFRRAWSNFAHRFRQAGRANRQERRRGRRRQSDLPTGTPQRSPSPPELPFTGFAYPHDD